MTSADQNPSSENWLVAVGTLDPSAQHTLLQLDSGRIVSIPTKLLLGEASAPSAVLASGVEGTTVIPVIKEELVITKRQVPLETIRLAKTVEEETEQVEVSICREHWAINRVPVGAEVATRSDVRYEGDVAIYPVYEERIITRKALFLVEEVHVSKELETSKEIVDGIVRREVLSVERIAP